MLQKPICENPTLVFPTYGNRTELSNTSNQYTQKSNTDLSNIHQSIDAGAPDGMDAIDIYREILEENIRNREAYIRKMVLDGYIVRLDLSDVRKMVQLLSNATSNLNQIARRANETRSVYESDIRDLQANYEKLWEQAEAILRGLAKMKR